jgi:hypothetical protein
VCFRRTEFLLKLITRHFEIGFMAVGSALIPTFDETCIESSLARPLWWRTHARNELRHLDEYVSHKDL